ncbi:MAG: ISAs1 family transposase [Geminicoccaceae bacterium]
MNTPRHLVLALDRDDLQAAFRRHACALSASIGLAGRDAHGRARGQDAARQLRSCGRSQGGPRARRLRQRRRPHPGPPGAGRGAGRDRGGAAADRRPRSYGRAVHTADALHCHREGFAQAAASGNALLVRVQENRPTLHAALVKRCAEQPACGRHESVDRRRHGRQEHRCVEVFDTAGQLDAPWQELIACVARVSRLTYTKDTRSGLWPAREEVGYYACQQVRRDAETLAHAIRAHWGIENRAHYVRDVSLGEDASRIRNRPGVMARLRSLALNILRANAVRNVSEALHVNALSFERLLALGLSRQN